MTESFEFIVRYEHKCGQKPISINQPGLEIQAIRLLATTQNSIKASLFEMLVICEGVD